MSTPTLLDRPPSTDPGHLPPRDPPRRIWPAALGVLLVVLLALGAALAAGMFGEDTGPEAPGTVPPPVDASEGPAVDEPAAEPPTLTYAEEPRANWDVAGIPAGGALDVHRDPGDTEVVATLPSDAAEFESTGRIAYVDEALWREVVVPGDGVGWVDAAYLVPTAGGSPVALADGEHFGFVSAFTVEQLRFDPAELFHDGAATDAARADGVIEVGEDLPNPFYIRDGDQNELTLKVADGFEATLISGATMQPTRPLGPTQLASLFEGVASRDAYYGFVAEELPVIVTVQGGAVVSLAQQYLP